jgi:hypothetical protein
MFQRPQPPVLIDRDYHRGLAAQVYEVVLVAISSGLRGHGSIVEKEVTFGMDFTRRGG